VPLPLPAELPTGTKSASSGSPACRALRSTARRTLKKPSEAGAEVVAALHAATRLRTDVDWSARGEAGRCVDCEPAAVMMLGGPPAEVDGGGGERRPELVALLVADWVRESAVNVLGGGENIEGDLGGGENIEADLGGGGVNVAAD